MLTFARAFLIFPSAARYRTLLPSEISLLARDVADGKGDHLHAVLDGECT